MSINYKDSGVDVTAGYKAVDLMKKHVKSTFDKNVLTDIGSFGGLYSIAGFNLKNPVLVAGTDGVGTKLKYAFITDIHDTIGIDCVAMCANDVVCQGARPLLFLDYIASSKIIPEKIASVVAGVAEGCKLAGCALIGGETAEMPGFYAGGEYDIAGFCVGIADKDKLITPEKVKAGDVLIGLASSGIHSNGFSLVRKLFGYDLKELNKTLPEYGKTLVEVLMEPTRIYVRAVIELLEKFDIHGIAHITGGGFIENIPRIFPSGIGGKINLKAYEIPPIFKIMRKKSGMADGEIYNTFNMGIGMVLAAAKKDADAVLKACAGLGEKACVIGETVKGEGLDLVNN